MSLSISTYTVKGREAYSYKSFNKSIVLASNGDENAVYNGLQLHSKTPSNQFIK